MQHRTLALVIGCASIGVAVAAGCGGSSGTDLTAPGDAGSSSDGSSAADANGASSGSIPNNGPDGGVNPPDAGPGGNTSAVLCGSTSCNIATEVCCVSRTNAGTSYGCATGTTCPAAGGGGNNVDVTALKCSGAANCPTGTVCCVSQTNAGATSACQASCTNNQAQLCDPAAADAGGCAPSQPCSSNNIGDWGLPRTYGTCGGKGN